LCFLKFIKKLRDPELWSFLSTRIHRTQGTFTGSLSSKCVSRRPLRNSEATVANVMANQSESRDVFGWKIG